MTPESGFAMFATIVELSNANIHEHIFKQKAINISGNMEEFIQKALAIVQKSQFK